jgi:hypothetical protein
MTYKTISMLTLALTLTLSTGALAHDLMPPPWRGQPNSTLQEWTFNTDANPAVPDRVDNLFGAPTATITVGAFGSGWQEQLPGLGTQTGYWDIGDAVEGAQIAFEIPNSPDARLYKEIWVQVTSWVDLNQAPIVNVPGAMFLGSEQVVVEPVPTGGNWVMELTKWRIEPNPSQEQIILAAVPMFGAVVDQVVVDTICTPEPASLLILLAGGTAALIRRRHMGR